MTTEDVMGVVIVVLLCLMVVTLLIMAVSILMDSISSWQERKAERRKNDNA